MKRSLFVILGFVLLTGFTTYAAITGSYPRQAGPYVYAQTPYDSTNINGIGGIVRVYMVAAADTERIGNVVYVSAKNTVTHSATLANYNALAGVVVGGASTSMKASTAVGDTSTIAALPGKQVLVLQSGRAWVLADTGAGFAPGTAVIPSSKSAMGGRLAARTTAIDTFNRVFGRTIDTTISGKAVLVDVRVK